MAEPSRSAASVAQKNGIASVKQSTSPVSVFGYRGLEAHSARFDTTKKSDEAAAESKTMRRGRVGDAAARLPRKTTAANAA